MRYRPEYPQERELWRRFAGLRGPAGPCPDENDLAAYVDGAASMALAERIERHMARCGACLAAVRETRAVLVAPKPRRIWFAAVRWATAAAAAVLIAVAGFSAGSATCRSQHQTDAALVTDMSFEMVAPQADTAESDEDEDLDALLAWAGGEK